MSAGESPDDSAFTGMGGLDAKAARGALLQKQYFPNVKPPGEELPELLSSESFSLECAKELAALGGKGIGVLPGQNSVLDVLMDSFDALVCRTRFRIRG